MTELPDPTIDLDWTGYVGSIQSIFKANAEVHPDRTCVVETKSSEGPERRFTYRQIYEASNVLAHYLHNAGVTNGDVVMIWAHRSVDLVVSFMGALASSATISVLDPAYPPARQKIYLEVAQPRALVQIARATDEAGPLAPSVRSYIDDELDLKTEVPSLRLGDDGSLSGGNDDHGNDLFAQARTLASSPPDAQVGPDSAPTLSFTSGSEGRPKGVLGRHFSLAKYFGWMAKRFELTSESRYTLLSGIAHDPVQRDIFTPLFLGAQLLVPSREDIQHEKLAEWMREHKPTVTHLTPAMGQILVGGATAKFPSLNRAFFVGDVLTKRDCRSLQSLAPNVNIVNMYGTTETQRAVSYYEIPSQARDPHYLEKLKDTVPAGKGMENVQLLVVNREDRNKLCGVGEVGEIYVRAAGLAEGYMGDKALNEQKFLMNWFLDNQLWVDSDKKNDRGEPWRKYFRGPRDRLYRTGDLGRYLESGDVECTGRADDQVKIRGFRIELNDIDSNLSQSALIRDCKTLVRRDRNEEATLVSYLVPELKEWPQWLKARGLEDIEDEGTDIGPTRVFFKRFRRMQTEVRDHLKGRLPSHAVPTTYIVLSKLPLNPNGKVDKPNLPFPDIVEQTEEASDVDIKRWDALTETQRAVATQWAELIPGLNAKTVKLDNEFFDLGGHSILAQQMLLNVRKNLGAEVSINTLYAHPSLGGFSSAVDKHLGKTNGINGVSTGAEETESPYAQSLDELLKQLPATYQAADPDTIRTSSNPTVLLTGATGFLGAYIIKDVLERTNPSLNLIAHVRGVKDPTAALDRVRLSLQSYGIWRPEWTSRLSCVVGDLSQPQLGISPETWSTLSQTVEVLIHNGATVHWVKPYKDMKAANVLSTIDAMTLCNTGKPKLFTYVSSTSVLDTPHYISLSTSQDSSQGFLSETDDLNGSRTGLGTGYGQTKWVSEKLVMEAGKRGLRGCIVRPGYILGDSSTGVCNTDDFLIRMLKGCIQLSARPLITNTVNAVPVNHVARVVVAAAFHPLPVAVVNNNINTNNHEAERTGEDIGKGEGKTGIHILHITAHPRLRMNEYLSSLPHYGYPVPQIPYTAWKSLLSNYVSAGGHIKDQEQHALMPLYHFCIDDLPATTRAPELDDANAGKVLEVDRQWTGVDESAGCGVGREDVGRYLRYLAGIGFVGWPVGGAGRELPMVESGEGVGKGAVGGRGGVGV